MSVLRFVEGAPALYIWDSAKPTLVISDLHIGIEEEFRGRGVYVPVQTQRMVSRLSFLANRVGARRLVVLGDIKHSVHGVTPFEVREINEFFGAVVRIFEEVLVVPGNHDGGIYKHLFRWLRVSDPRGVVLEVGGARVAFTHGHTHPPSYVVGADVMVTGHHHFYVKGVPGSVDKYPVWVKLVRDEKPNEVVVVPAFNELVGGISLDEVLEEKRSPVLRLLLNNPDRAEVYSIEGFYLGPLSVFRAGLEVEDE